MRPNAPPQPGRDNAATALFTLLFSFSGRISRSAWWLGFSIGLVAAIAGSLVIDPDVWTADPPRAPAPLLALWDVAWVIPMTAITVKRFNDRDWPNWFGYALGVLGLALILAEQAGFLVDPDAATAGDWAIFFVAAVILCAAFVDNGFLRGTPGPNQYGPDPLESNGSSSL